jgi:oxalate decarboxylase
MPITIEGVVMVGSDEDGVVLTVRGHEGATILGPRNIPFELENFRVPVAAFDDIPDAGVIDHERYIFNGTMPGPLASDAVHSPAGPVPNEHEPPQYWISGQGRMTVFAAGGKARTFDYRAGDVGYVPFALGHYVENTGDEPVMFLEMFRSDHFADFSLRQWMALMPAQMVRDHLNLDPETIAALSKDKPLIVP